MKVLMLVENDFLNDQRVEKVTESLIQLGYTVQLACIESEHLPKNEVKGQLEIHRVLPPSWFLNPLKREFSRGLQQSLKAVKHFDFNFIHCNDWYLAPLAVELKKQRPTAKLVYDAHEYLPGFWLYETSKGWLNKLKGYAVWKSYLYHEKRLIKHADALLTTSDVFENRLKKRFPKKLVAHLRNFPKAKTLTPVAFKQALNIDENATLIAASGNLYFEDEVFKQLCELTQLINFHLVFIVDESRSLIQRSIAKSYSNVHFIDFPKNHTICNYLAGADAGLYYKSIRWDSNQNTSANRFLEYAYAGIPIIAPKQAESEWLHQQFNNCVFYTDGNTESLIQAIQEFIKNQHEICNNARQTFEVLSWTKNTKIIENVYHEIDQYES